MKVWGGSRVTVWEWNFSYRIVCIENIKYVSTSRKRCLQLHQWSFSFLIPQNTQFFSFLLKSVWERSKIIVCEKKKIQHYSLQQKFQASACLPWKKNKWYSLRYFRLASKYLDFCYTKFARDQRSQFNSDMLHKLFFAMEVLETCLSYVKNYF